METTSDVVLMQLVASVWHENSNTDADLFLANRKCERVIANRKLSGCLAPRNMIKCFVNGVPALFECDENFEKKEFKFH